MIESLEQERFEEARTILSTITFRIAVPLYFIFWGLDLVYVPQYKWEFLGIRTLIIPTALTISWWLQRARSFRDVERAALFLIFMCAGLLSLMIHITGKGSLYVIPMQLVAMGGLTFFPYQGRYFVYALLAVYVPYYVIELSRLESSADVKQLVVYSFFIIGVVVITKVIYYYREQLQERENAIRKDLEAEVAHRKQTEQQLIAARDEALAATKAKDAFLANMSHEIRTPLTAIIGFAEYSLDKSLSTEERLASLNTIATSGNHLLSIINDILDFSKIEADSIEIEHLDINPVQQASEVQSLVMALAAKRNLYVKLEYKFPLPASITTDPVRLKQILINVCSNAIKFTEQGGITITLAFDAKRNAMSYSIKDTGIGMTPEQLQKIFDPFKQADSSITRRYGGTGLGLSLSRRLAELLGGSLQVNSEFKQGSEFIISIDAGNLHDVPLLQSIEQIAENTANRTNDTVEVRLQGKVLLAEDNENNQRLFSLYLNKMGAQVTIVDNGAKALECAGKQDFDLIFMDMQMPIMSGIDAVTRLRQDGYDKPILALTANATKEDRQQCLAAGCNDFVTKPISRDRLYQAAAQYLQPAPENRDSNEPLFSSMLDEDPEFIDIIVLFVNKLPDIVNRISTAYYEKNWEKFKKEIHSLKGTAGGVGYQQLTELAADIEKSLINRNYPAIEHGLAEMAKLVVRIRAGGPRRDKPDQGIMASNSLR